jgi:FimV-like protein
MLDLNVILWWGAIGLVCILLITYLFSNSRRQKEIAETSQIEESSESLEPVNFPGEDPLASQLDLARAYMDMGKLNLAQQILNKVLLEGDESQQAIAKRLLTELK